MIEIHSHMIYGIDDGCKDIEESLFLLTQAQQQGIDVVVCTPHYMINGRYHVPLREWLARFKHLQEAVQTAGLSIRLALGNEIMIHRDLCQAVEHREVIGLNDTDYLLIEFPFHHYQDWYDEILLDLTTMGKRIIIAHPERYRYVQKDVNFCLRWLDCGYYLQCNQDSLWNQNSQVIKTMLDHEFISFMSSDAHHRQRPFRLADAYRFLEQYVGQKQAERLCQFNAQQMLMNEEVVKPAYREVKKGPFKWLERG